MSLIHSNDHTANVCTTLGLKASEGNAQLAGIEIETGWINERQRQAFFKELEKRGVDIDCISKHDGTIGRRDTTATAEIVSRPMTFDNLKRFAESVGKAIESKADKGLVTTGCGIHIHVSEGLVQRDQLWRYAAAICQDSPAIALWTHAKESADTLKLSTAVHSFWNDISLRPGTNYSRRLPYEKVAQIRNTTDHKRAFIHGRSTPTYETRIFRTPKSWRIMSSYVDTVKSLLDFSQNASDDHFEVFNRVMPEVVEAIVNETTRPLRATPGPKGTNIYYDTETGEQFLPGQVIQRGKLFFCTEQDYLRGKRIPTLEEINILADAGRSKGARGWTLGTIHIPSYMDYVLAHADEYPHLAQRFGYDKFLKYTRPVEEKVESQHINEPHLEFRPGCKVRVEEERGELYTLLGLIPSFRDGDEGPLEMWHVARDEDGHESRYSIHRLIHACKGALEVGGEI